MRKSLASVLSRFLSCILARILPCICNMNQACREASSTREKDEDKRTERNE